jgi:putative hydrolase of the HAD superfamily
MVKAILFDLFETLITESGVRPPGVSSRASRLGCECEALRAEWKTLRSAVMTGRMSFRGALSEITTRLGHPADDVTLEWLYSERRRTKAEPFAHIEYEVLAMADDLRSRNIRLGVVSNCCAEDVGAWPTCSLASRFDCAVFSFEVGLAKPDPEIYREAMRRLGVHAREAWFIGDGGHDELTGAKQAGLRAFRALWFLRRWPHFRDEAGSDPALGGPGEIISRINDAQSGRA